MIEHAQLSKSATGIDGLDAITEGGLPTGRPTLLCGAAGCGKTLFGVTFLVQGAVRFKQPGVLMTFEERPDDISANVDRWDMIFPALSPRKAWRSTRSELSAVKARKAATTISKGYSCGSAMRSTPSAQNESS